MVFALTLAALAFRAGLEMRGFAVGPISALLLRDWRPFETLHAWLGLAAAGLFANAGWLGWKLQTGRVRGERRRIASRHGLIGTLALLAAAGTAVAGLVLLP
jgi:hypothetical protein